MNKRTFLKNVTLAGVGGMLSFDGLANAFKNVSAVPLTELASDETFWASIRKGYKLKPDFINLENGYYNILPEQVLEKFIAHVREVNYQGSYYMRNFQVKTRSAMTAKLADLAGCSADELIITRNTTESLDLVISGLDWKQGDEAIFAEQDYGTMRFMFEQVAKRYGMINKIVSVPNLPESDDEIVNLYAAAITPKTKLIMVSHMINITGQILPVRKICDMAHGKGVQVMVDGAHSLAHVKFSIDDLHCDYFGSSLHKWLSVPLGCGILYVKKAQVKNLWPLLAGGEKEPDDITRLGHTGTHPAHTDLAIGAAIDFYNMIGAERKEARLRFLQNYWTSKVRHLPNVIVNTPADEARSCGIANVGVRGMKPADLADTLFTKHKIYTAQIDGAGVHGCRITPNVYTATAELDVLVHALKNMTYAILFFLLPLFGIAQSEKVDLEVMKKIREEGVQHSKVMDIAFQITELSGPRLTNSAGFMKAADYAKDQFTAWGLLNARLDPWGEFGKGWELQRSYVAINAPWYRPLTAYPRPWSGSTNGAQQADVLLITANDSASLDRYRGKLKGKILIIDDLIKFELMAKPGPVRRTDEDLQKLGEATEVDDTAMIRRRRERSTVQNGGLRAMRTRLKKLAVEDGAIALLSSDADNNRGTIFIQQGGPYGKSDPANLLDLVVGLEDYNMIVRMLRNNTPVKMEVDIKTKFQATDTKGYNVIAEIPGTDQHLKEEIVMLGAHLDSWTAANGATDNAAGVSAMMEAVRILKAIGVKPRRTIRIALWSGEEQGLFGSQGYVTKTFGDAATKKWLPAHDKFSVYFNLDYGTGKILGINLQGNEAARSIFQDWFLPFHDLRAKTVTIRNSYATDHMSFDAIGLPGFQFIQDQLRTQHSNMDSYEYLSADDLKQSATIVAAFVFNAAMREEKIPRKSK